MKLGKKFKKFVATTAAVATVATAGVATVRGVEKKIEEHKGKAYTVQAGDTLFDIARNYYGNGIYYEDIAKANHIKNADDIKEGQVVILPAEVGKNVKRTDPTYTVVKGDDLTKICEKYYNDGSYATALKLAKYNNLENADEIKIGQVLYMPQYNELILVEIDLGRSK